MEIIFENKLIILAFLLSLSEVLAIIPSIEANSIFQLCVSIIKKLSGK